MSTGHTHALPSERNEKSLWIALALTGSFLLAEVAAGIVFNSLALLSDAAHMFTDAAALAIALAAVRVARRPADAKRTYGYYRFEILAAAFNALLLFGVAGYILYEGWQRLREPAQVQSSGMLVVAVLGLIVNLISMRMLQGGKDKSLNVKGAYLEVWSDMLGSVGVIIGAIVIKVTGWTLVDPIIAVLIGLWVLPRTWTLLKQAGHILMQGVPEGMDVAAIRKRLIEMPAVQEVHDLHVWSLGTGQVVLTAHIVLAAGVPDPDTIQVELTRVIEQQFDIHDVTLQVERTSCKSEVGHA